MPHTVCDANYVLRWFLNDVPEQELIVQGLLTDSPIGCIYLDRTSMAEVSYVLRNKGYDNKQISTVIREFCFYSSVKSLSGAVNLTLDIFEATTLDFEDCFIIAYCKINKAQPVTFDKKLLKVASQIGAL